MVCLSQPDTSVFLYYCDRHLFWLTLTVLLSLIPTEALSFAKNSPNQIHSFLLFTWLKTVSKLFKKLE